MPTSKDAPEVTWWTVARAAEHLSTKYDLSVSRATVRTAASRFWQRVAKAHRRGADAETLRRAAMRTPVHYHEIRCVRIGEGMRRAMYLCEPESVDALELNLPHDHPQYRTNARGGRHLGSGASWGRYVGQTRTPVEWLAQFGAWYASGQTHTESAGLPSNVRKAAAQLVAQGLLTKDFYEGVGAAGRRRRARYTLTDAGHAAVAALPARTVPESRRERGIDAATDTDTEGADRRESQACPA